MATQFRRSFIVQRELLRAFPNLRRNRNWRIRSPFSDSYQCVAWAACYTNRKWWPVHHTEFHWPPNLPKITPPAFPWLPWATPVDYLEQGFATLGYTRCDNAQFEFGYQKVAIYANNSGATHMARQDFFGRGWLSKPGELEDILHKKLSDLEGEMSSTAFEYGRVAQVLKRSWWSAVINGGAFRCLWHGLKFRIFRLWWRLLNEKRRLLGEN
jgi:hypothetical protein